MADRLMTLRTFVVAVPAASFQVYKMMKSECRMTNGQCALPRVTHFCRASVSDAGISQNGAAGTRATSTGTSLERVSGRERVKRPTIAANARDRFVWAICDLLRCRWLAGLSKLLEAVELLIKHALYSWRDLVESADDESTDTIRELNAGVVAVAGQLPGHASGNTGGLKRAEASREPQNFPRRDINDTQMFDSAAVRQLLAETTARPGVNREVLRIV